MTLTRADILKADDLKREEVPVPEWGGSVFVRTITAEERDEFEQAVFDLETDKKIRMRNIRARTLSLCLVDEKGTRLFSDADIEQLGRKAGNAVDRCFSVAQRLNSLSEKDIEELLGK